MGASRDCPACARRTGTLYRCPKCGDVRCNSGHCPGTNGGSKGAVGTASRCRACGKATYEQF